MLVSQVSIRSVPLRQAVPADGFGADDVGELCAAAFLDFGEVEVDREVAAVHAVERLGDVEPPPVPVLRRAIHAVVAVDRVGVAPHDVAELLRRDLAGQVDETGFDLAQYCGTLLVYTLASTAACWRDSAPDSNTSARTGSLRSLRPSFSVTLASPGSIRHFSRIALPEVPNPSAIQSSLRSYSSTVRAQRASHMLKHAMHATSIDCSLATSFCSAISTASSASCMRSSYPNERS